MGHRLRVPRRRHPVRGRRLHRHERRRALERPHGGGGPGGSRPGLPRRVPRRLGHGAPRRRPRPARGRGVLLGAHRLARELARVGGRRPDRPRVRRLAHLGLRPPRRRHLHESRRRRGRPRRQDRGRHPGGRPAEPGRHRRQRRRQRRRLRRDGGGPVRDLRRDRRRRDAPRHVLPFRRALALPARPGRHVHPRVRDRHVLRPDRPRRERDHQRALQERADRDDPLGGGVHPGHASRSTATGSRSGSSTSRRSSASP